MTSLHDLPMGLKKRAVAACLVALLATALASGAGWLECEQPVFDFGTTQDLATVEHAFRLRNRGDAPVAIRGVRTSCGCAAATLADEPIVHPGAALSVHTRFLPGGRRGPQRKRFRVETDSTITPVVDLWHVGSVEAEVALEPPFVNLGRIDGAKTASCEVAISTLQPGTWIESVTCESGAFTATPAAGASPLSFRIETIPSPAPGARLGRISVATTGRVSRTLTLNVAAVVDGAVQVIPRQLSLSRAGGRTQRRSILLRSGQARPLAITRIELPDASGRAAWTDLGAGRYRIDVDGIEPGDHLQDESVAILTDCPDAAEILVPIRLAP